ncbi:MAG: aminoglycoside phosphotransferase family protein [Spirochaetaceae bacterium]|nr:aminoglycoside phosphotransferase family protein [Spirochaetaceae bacterium]
MKNIIGQFSIHGEFEDVVPYGQGHINDTYRSRWNQAGTTVRYLHQRINHAVFTRPDEVMENILRVTRHIADKLAAAGTAGWSRRVLTVVPSREGKPWVRDAQGGWWRTYLFIENTHSLDVAASPEEARFLGASIGNFQKQLTDLHGGRLHETIPHFHDMESRYRRFHEALRSDFANRAEDTESRPDSRAEKAAAEITFMQENEERGAMLIRALREGRIPERICHNDTKMNNILIDNADNRVLCVADLDTVMPGTSLFDLGDLIRTAASRAEEDERDLAKVVFDPAFFQALLEGYLSEALDFLTPAETALLAEAGRNITQIMALRFLTDYLEGDHYYHTARPGHNLDRCRNQIALIRSMDAQWEALLATAQALSA